MPKPVARALRLSAFLPFQLSVLTNTISRRLAQRYEAEFGLSIWQWRVMAVLGESPRLTASAVTERTAMDKVAVSRAVAGLVARGLLARAAVQGDGRRSELALTAQGEGVYRRIAAMALDHERTLAAALTPGERVQLGALLAKLAAAASPERPLW